MDQEVLRQLRDLTYEMTLDPLNLQGKAWKNSLQTQENSEMADVTSITLNESYMLGKSIRTS